MRMIGGRVRAGGASAGAAVVSLMALMALLVPVLAACGGPVPAGAAAIVGDSRVTTQSLADQVAEVQRGLGRPVDEPDEALVRTILQRLVIGNVIDVAADRQGIVVSPGDVDATILSAEAQLGSREAVEQSLLDSSIPPSALVDWVRFNLTIQALAVALAPDAAPEQQQVALFEYVVSVADEIGVTISPRFGTWNPADLQIGLPPTELAVPPSDEAADPLLGP